MRIEGNTTTTGSGARRWNPSRPEPAGTRSPDGLPCPDGPRKNGSYVQVRWRGGGHGRQRRQTLRLGDEGRRGTRPRRERHDQDGGHGQARDHERHTPGTLVPRIPGRRPGGAQTEAQGQTEGREVQAEARTHARAGARRGGCLPEGEGRVPGKTPGPAGAEVTRRERSAVVRLLAGRGHRLDQLLRIAGLARSTYFYHLSHPELTRADLGPLVGEVWGRTPNGCGHRQVRMCLVHEFGRKVSAKSVLGVMRRMRLRCAIRSRNPWKRYNSYRGDEGGHVHNLPERDFDAARPFSKLGTDVTEFKVSGGKAYLAPVYDMASKEIVARDVSRSPDLGRQRRLLAMLAERLPAGAEPILHSDMGWQYQHRWWRDELERLGIRRSMSRRQRRHRAGLRPLEGRVLPRPRVRLVRAVQARAGCVHHPLGHQTAPDTTRGTHPGGVPEHVPRGLGLYPN